MSSYASGALESRAFAKPIPRYNRGVSRTRLNNPRPSLADDCSFARGFIDVRDDPECDAFTWPEMMDQRRIGAFASTPFWDDDAEEDDNDTGIDDESHDALEEDGI